MSEEFIVNAGAIVLGTVVIGGVLWLSLRSPSPKGRKHPARKRIEARRDNDRNVPPDTF